MISISNGWGGGFGNGVVPENFSKANRESVKLIRGVGNVDFCTALCGTLGRVHLSSWRVRETTVLLYSRDSCENAKSNRAR